MQNDSTPQITQEDFFARLPKTVLYHPELTGNDIRVYGALSERAGSKRSAWPGVRRLGEDIHLAPNTVTQCLHKLESLGFVEVEREGGKVNHYHLPAVFRTVAKTATPVDKLSQNLRQTVAKSATELDPRTRDTFPNGNAKAPPDGLFEAFFEFWMGRPYNSGERVLKSERGRLNQAVKEAREIGVTAEDVEARAERYRRTWPQMERTPQALLANWSRFAEDAEAPPSSEGRIDPSPPRNASTECLHRALMPDGECAGCNTQVAYRDGDGLKWLPGKAPPEAEQRRRAQKDEGFSDMFGGLD